MPKVKVIRLGLGLDLGPNHSDSLTSAGHGPVKGSGNYLSG